MCYNKLIFHLIFSTHLRERTIDEEHEDELYAIISGAMKHRGGFVHAIGGMHDHVHIVVELPPTVLLSDFVKSVKQYTSSQLTKSKSFPRWSGWGRSYGVFSCSPLALEPVLRYVRNQKKHHAKVSFEAELKIVLSSVHIPYNDTRLR